MSNFEISWFGPHFGEEPSISGSGGLARRSLGEGGSGTIFFCRCNLRCVYCQNWQISQEKFSCETVSEAPYRTVQGEVELLRIMFLLQDKGCHNINLVSPTTWASKLKTLLKEAKQSGLNIPIVWNSNAYETVKVLRDLEGLVDIYLPDYKYSDDNLAVKYSNAPGYPILAKEAILEMQRQVGDLQVDEKGIAKKGLIIRHLVLPRQMENTRKCLEFIRSVSPNIHLSLMSQYNPTYKAKDCPEINRTLTKEEYGDVLKMVESFDFKFGWVQEFEGAVKCLNPDFSKINPFSADFLRRSGQESPLKR